MLGRLCLGVLLTLTLSACITPASVKMYADATKQTADSVKTVAVDYRNICPTRRAYLLVDDSNPLASCDDVEKLGDALITVSTVLSDYGATLAQLSSGASVTYVTNTGDLGTAVEAIPAFKNDKEKIAALTQLAQLASSWFGQTYQEKEIIKALSDSHQPIIQVTEALANAMNDVTKEYAAESVGYKGLVKGFGARPTLGSDYAVWIMFNDWAITRSMALAGKQGAAAALSKQILKIGTTNTDLLNHAKDIKAKDALQVGIKFYQEASPVWEKVHDAYHKP